MDRRGIRAYDLSIKMLVSDLDSSSISAVKIQRISDGILSAESILRCLIAVAARAMGQDSGEDSTRHRRELSALIDDVGNRIRKAFAANAV